MKVDRIILRYVRIPLKLEFQNRWQRIRDWTKLIVELRSATAGAGGFKRQFERMAEVTGRDADKIIAAHRDAA